MTVEERRIEAVIAFLRNETRPMHREAVVKLLVLIGKHQEWETKPKPADYEAAIDAAIERGKVNQAGQRVAYIRERERKRDAVEAKPNGFLF